MIQKLKQFHQLQIGKKHMVSEKDIRPHQLMLDNKALHEEDVKILLQRLNNFVLVNCPACSGNNYQLKFKKNGFNFVECTNCATLYVNPRPSMSMLAEFYSTSKSIQHWSNIIFPESDQIRYLEIAIPRAELVIDTCRKYLTSNRVALDIGSGFGSLCSALKDHNYFERIVALELSPDAVRACRERQIDVIEKSAEELTSLDIQGVDLITNFELIEHLYDPYSFLMSCFNILEHNGMIILSTPNIHGFDLQTLGALSENIDAPNHINYFNVSSLNDLLEKIGFHVLQILTPGQLDAEIVRNQILCGSLNIKDQPFLTDILLTNWSKLGQVFQRFLVENKMSSHMVAIARKP